MEILKGCEFNFPLKFGFDAEGADVDALKTNTGFILWSLIRQNHIADQYFNDKVKQAADYIDNSKPKNYYEFKYCLSALNEFGRVGITTPRSTSVFNDVFWLGVYHVYINQHLFTYEFNNEIRTLKDYKIVNPHLFV